MKYTLIFLFIISVMSVYCQKQTDIIYLKNGSILKGILIEQVPNETYTLKMADGSIFVFKAEEIIKITKEGNIKNQKPFVYKEQEKKYVYFHAIEPVMGIFLGGRSYNTYPSFYTTQLPKSNVVSGYPNMFGIHSISQFQGRKNHMHGIGIGLEFFFKSNVYENLAYNLPIYYNYRYIYQKTRISPLFDIRMGGLFSNYPDKLRPGAFLNLSPGMNIKTNKKTDLNFMIGYRLIYRFETDNLTFTDFTGGVVGNGNIRSDIIIHQVSIQAGVRF